MCRNPWVLFLFNREKTSYSWILTSWSVSRFSLPRCYIFSKNDFNADPTNALLTWISPSSRISALWYKAQQLWAKGKNSLLIWLRTYIEFRKAEIYSRKIQRNVSIFFPECTERRKTEHQRWSGFTWIRCNLNADWLTSVEWHRLVKDGRIERQSWSGDPKPPQIIWLLFWTREYSSWKEYPQRVERYVQGFILQRRIWIRFVVWLGWNKRKMNVIIMNSFTIKS